MTELTTFSIKRWVRGRLVELHEIDRLQSGDVIELEDIPIAWPNFNGDPTPYDDRGGKRYFTACIEDPQMAAEMRDIGWYIRPQLEDRSDPNSDILFWKFKVNIRYNPGSNSNPKVYLCVAGESEDLLPEDLVGQLDGLDILNADLKISAYDYSAKNPNSTGTGISAYLREGWFNVEPSRFARKHQSSHTDDEIPF